MRANRRVGGVGRASPAQKKVGLPQTVDVDVRCASKSLCFQGTTSASDAGVVGSRLDRLSKVARTCLHGFSVPLETNASVASNCDGLPGPDRLLYDVLPRLSGEVAKRHPSALHGNNNRISRSVHERRLLKILNVAKDHTYHLAPPVCSQLASLETNPCDRSTRLTPPSRPQRTPDLS